MITATNDQFKANFAARMALAQGNLDIVVRKTALELLRSMVLKTPVDTGRLRANWQVGLNVTDATTTDSDDPVSRAEARLGSFEAGMTIYLTNALPYAAAVEYGLYPDPPKLGTYVPKGSSRAGFSGPGYVQLSSGGYSKQAPSGMVRITLVEYGAYLQKVVAELGGVPA